MRDVVQIVHCRFILAVGFRLGINGKEDFLFHLSWRTLRKCQAAEGGKLLIFILSASDSNSPPFPPKIARLFWFRKFECRTKNIFHKIDKKNNQTRLTTGRWFTWYNSKSIFFDWCSPIISNYQCHYIITYILQVIFWTGLNSSFWWVFLEYFS